jgi:predicted ATPase/class 3 adenylate cyclase
MRQGIVHAKSLAGDDFVMNERDGCELVARGGLEQEPGKALAPHGQEGGMLADRGGLRRALCAVLCADAAGYTRLMGNDEQATVAALDAARSVFRNEIEARDGRVIDMAGDSVLAVFGAVGEAVDAAVAVQVALLEQASNVADDRKMLFRIGVHLGDIVVKSDGTVYGDGVNIAARLESLAPPGGVTVSELIPATIANACTIRFRDMGEHSLKNVPRPMRVFLVDDDSIVTVTQLTSGSVSAPLGNLPAQFTSLIGREDALAEVAELLEEQRLITVLGMGGLGKTRLAIEVAARCAPTFPDGAWFVDLAAVKNAEAVGLAAAGVFGVASQAGKSIEESLVDALGARRLLIVLDNCEHLTEAAAYLAHSIIACCRYVKIIATSREVLSVDGERIWRMPALPVDGENAPAVQLFVERARTSAPDFTLAQHGEAVSRICCALDGIPLAIELAAARARSMTPAQILDRLNQRFRLLTGGSRGKLRERHQTLRNAVQWSFDYLTPSEQAVVSRAAVFAGGFTLEAAEQVCEGDGVDLFDVCDLLNALVNKSLLNVQRPNGDVRFGMLDTIRSFGLELLQKTGEIDEVRRRHAAFFARQSGERFDVWRSAREGEAYAWLDLEIHNLRDAFRWACEHDDLDSAAWIASSVGDMGRFRLREEAAAWAEEIIDKARSARHPRLAILLTWCASSAWAFSRLEDAKRFGEEAIALRDDPAFHPFIWAYGDLAFVSIFGGDIEGAIDLLRIGSEHPTDRTDRFMLAFHLYILATAGFAEQAAQIADEVVAKVDSAGVPMAISVAYGAKGAALEATDPAAALAAYEHGIEVARQAGTRFMEALIAPRLAALHARSGVPAAALRGFARMLSSFGEATDLASVSAWRASLLVVLAKLGRFEAAATLYGTFAELIDATGVVPDLPDTVEKARAALGEDAFASAMARGAAMSLREASDYAIDEIRRDLNALALEQGIESDDDRHTSECTRT